MILKCCIIDDEPLAIELLESYVKRTPFLQLEASFNSAVQAVERVAQGDIDLIFLDIQMPELDGMEFSHMIEGRSRIVFTTAFGQYAVDSYKVNAIDYLLKPISYADFLKASQKAAMVRVVRGEQYRRHPCTHTGTKPLYLCQERLQTQADTS